jgi:5'-3' exonuclease
MIIIDYSGCAIAAILAFSEDLKREESHIENLIRHVIISTIKTYKKKFSAEYGNEIVIACDSNHYWRKDVFPHYKAGRKKAREESDIPWSLIFKYMEDVKKDLTEHFPYKVMTVYGAEADDIIAVLVQDVATNKNTESQLNTGDPEKTLIISSDKDAKQLLTHKNIRQWIPREKKYAQLEESSKQFLRKLILTGDKGDGVANVFSPADSFVTGIRQKPATEKKMLPMLEAKNMLDAAPDDFTKQRIIENTRMISFSAIPKKLREEISLAYEQKPTGNKMSIMKYLMSKDMKQMLDDLEDF